MLLYKNITRLQRRYVHEAMKYKDLIKNYPLITVSEQKKIHMLIRKDHKKRKTGIKIGYPWYWMNGENNRHSKGVYYLPVPTEHDLKLNEIVERGDKNLPDANNQYASRTNGITMIGNTTDPDEEGDFSIIETDIPSNSIDTFCHEAGIIVTKEEDFN